MQAASKPPISRRRLWLIRGVLVSLPLLLLALIEGGLRLWGWGGYPPFLREAGTLPGGEKVCIVEPAASKPYFFANRNRPGYAEQTNFLMPKPAGTVRIFLIGESAAKGFPQPRNLSISSFLTEILAAASPGRRYEVINLGTTAVASFPLVYQVRDALAYAPDLFVLYVGNNEFYGAYGTGSINAAGKLPPAVLRVQRALRGLAIVQLLDSWRHGSSDTNRTLMEQMIGRSVIPADSPLRAAAARNLRENLSTMLSDLGRAGVPVLVCTTASNEQGLAPLGEDDLTGLDETGKQKHRALLAEAEGLLRNDPVANLKAMEALAQAHALAPRSARTAFLLGRAHRDAGNADAARNAFQVARDLDTLPWRPTSATEQAIRDAAAAHKVPLCDIAERFRDETPPHRTGWELLDDHVHLSLAGQARAARAIAEALSGILQIPPKALEAVPGDEALSEKLGANLYDTYRVHHTLRVLFGVSFMRENNPEAFARFDAAVRAAEAGMSPAVLEAARQWQTFTPHAGGMRPITAMVARVLLRQGNTREALRLYEIARTQVPDYTSWYLEYVYFTLACREKINGALNVQDQAEAKAAIQQGEFMLLHGDSRTGLTERYIGRLHQLRGEWDKAIPFLQAARPRMKDEDLVACDQALILSHLRTGEVPKALALAEEGLRKNDRFSNIYRKLREDMLRLPR